MFCNGPLPKIHVLAIALLGMTALRCSQAALCDGFATEAECAGKVVDTGNCIWEEATSTCESDGTGTPPEVAGITAVEGSPVEEPMYPEQTDGDFCTLPADTGKCRGFFPSWYWDSETKSCKEFTYGGCPGNDNRFETPEACVASSERFCSAAASPSFYGSVLAAVILLFVSLM